MILGEGYVKSQQQNIFSILPLLLFVM